MRFLGLVSSRLCSVSRCSCAEMERHSRLWLVNGLVGDDQRLEVVAGVVDSLDQLRGKNSVGDLGALAHDGGPDGELGVVASGGQRDVVAVLTHALHHVLVHNRENETVEGAVGHLLRIARSVRWRVLGLVAVENVRGSLDALGGDREALEEQGDHVLGEQHEGVVALDQAHLEVDEGDILASSRVRLVLVRLLLLQDVVRHFSQLVPDLGELLLQYGRVCLGPGFRLSPVGARAPDVDEDQGEEEGQNVHLQLEVFG